MTLVDEKDPFQVSQQRLFIQDPQVLVADDVDMAATLLIRILRSFGFHLIHTSFNGEQALNNFHLVRPHLVFLDIEMPRVDGLEVLRQMREKDPHVDSAASRRTFISMVSGHNTLGNIQEAMAAGADGFVVKPYNRQKIMDIVGRFYQRWKQ